MLGYYKVINDWMPIKITSDEFINDQFHNTTAYITKIANSVDAARDVLEEWELEQDIYNYIHSHHSSIGTDIYHNDEVKCSAFLVSYYDWLAEERTPEIPSLPDIPGIPSLPSLPEIPSLPSLDDVKSSLQVIAVVIIAVVLLIVYMMTGKGEKGIRV